MYDEKDECWMGVNDLSYQIKQVKSEIEYHNGNRAKKLASKNSSILLTQEFLKSVCRGFKSPQTKKKLLSPLKSGQ